MYRMLQTAFGPSCMNRAPALEWHKRFKEGRESVRDDERCGRSKEVNTQSWLAKGLGLGLLCRVFKGFQEEIPSKEASTLSNRASGFSTRTIHQSTSPSLSQTIWPRWASRQFLSLPIVQTLLPVTFGYSLSSEGIVMRQLMRQKRLCHAHTTSMGPSRSCWNGTTSTLQPEEITSMGSRVLCVYYK